MKNKKGFTLIELLAVIVILAILMVAAGAAVMNTMNNARFNSFKDEALQAIDSAKMMYTDESMATSGSKIKSNADNKTMCVTLQGLVNNGYMEKDLSGGYSGYVLVVVPNETNEAKYYVNMTNGTYNLENIEKNNISSQKRGTETSNGTAVSAPSNSVTIDGTSYTFDTCA